MSIKTAVRIIDKDRGFKKLVEVLRRSKKALLVGLPGESGNQMHPDGGGLTLADLGNILEFGDPARYPGDIGPWHIPPRPFLSGTIDANMSTYKKVSITIAEKVLMQQTSLETGLSLLGERIISDIKKNIIAHIPPPNRPSTIRQKRGGDTPLINTGHLIGSLNYQIVEGQ